MGFLELPPVWKYFLFRHARNRLDKATGSRESLVPGMERDINTLVGSVCTVYTPSSSCMGSASLLSH